MAKAKVELKRAASFNDKRGRSFQKGRPQIITSEADIAYYKLHPEFVVTMMKEVKAKKPAAPPPDEVEGGDGDEGGGDADPAYTEGDLGKLTKGALVELAAGDFDLDLDGDLKKDEMVAEILKAQEAAAE
jgi:hypothetical protein